jgi:hypothetical protein
LLVATALSAVAGSAPAADVQRRLYAVNEAAGERGTISVYDIDAGHRLIRTIRTVPNVGDVRGVVVNARTGKLYVAYRDGAGQGMIYCLDLYDDRIVWNKTIEPGVDRLAIDPNGQLLYVPTGEDREADFINIVAADNGTTLRRVHFSTRSHDAQYPISGPIFQETKAGDGSGRYLYRVEPGSYAVSRIGPYAGILGPYAVDSRSRFVVDDVAGLWGMQVADLATGRIATAALPQHPPGTPRLMHGIGWTPDESEVWQSSSGDDPHVYIWSMSDPMAPVFEATLTLRSGRGSRWLTFAIRGDYAYVAPAKNSEDRTEIFDPRTHSSVGTIGSSEDMLEIDFENGEVSAVGDQFGIGRRRERPVHAGGAGGLSLRSEPR